MFGSTRGVSFGVMACAVIGVCAGSASAQLMGPYLNPANHHLYYRYIGSNNPYEINAIAQSLGGTLATINNSAENTWVFNTLVAGWGNMYIGYTDLGSEGSWSWFNGEGATFTAWDEGEPNNAGGDENYAIMISTRPVWNDIVLFGFAQGGIIEIEDNVYCDGAYELSVPGTVADRTEATFPGGSACPGTLHDAVWFSFTGYEAPVTLTTCIGETNFDTVLIVYKGDCSNATCIGSSDDAACGFQTTGSELSFFAEQGQRYLVAVMPKGEWAPNQLFRLFVYDMERPTPSIAAGPIFNPANGHAYYKTTPGIWPEQEALARSMGGHLATINNSAENLFVRDVVIGGPLPIGNNFIGFNDRANEGQFVWSSGETPGFTNWSPNEPNNVVNEDYTVIWGTGGWNDAPGHWVVPAIIELNADCADAIPMSVPGSVTASYVPGPLMPSEFGCGTLGVIGRGVWYRVVGDGSVFTASTCGSAINATLRVRTGDCGFLDCIVEDAGSCASGSSVTFYAEAGRTYFVVVGDYFDQGASGTYTLSLSRAAAEEVVYTARSEINVAECSRYYALSPSWLPNSSATARRDGMELATVGNAAENAAIRSFANAAGADSVWIGFSDLGGGVFSWLDGSPVTYTHWDFDEPNGNEREQFAEMQGHGYWNDLPYWFRRSGIAEAHVAAAPGGRIRGALGLHGGADGVDLPDNVLEWPGADFTIECWFRTTFGGIIFGQLGSNGGYVPMIYVGDDGQLRVAEWGPAGGEMITGPVVNDGVWRHLAFTRSGKTMALYVDGALSGTHVAPGVAYDPKGRYRYRLGNGLGDGWPAISHNGFIGDLDEVRLWSVARSIEEINASKDSRYFNPANSPKSLRVYLDLDDAGGRLAFDGATGAHGRLVAGAAWLYEDRNADGVVDACGPSCPADIDGNGVVNSTDVSAFINLWFADQADATLNADFNRDGVSNSTDVSDLINAYFGAGAGCV